MRIGIIGAGHLAGFVLEGLRRGGLEGPILLSPRGRARELADRYACSVAADNAGVVEASDLVLLSTRPGQVGEAITGLPWRADQPLVSAAAGVSVADLRAIAGPTAVARAMPVSCAAIGISPTALWPDDARARALLEKIGTVHVLPDEAAFEVASALGAYYAWVFALVEEGVRWTTRQGLEESLARDMVTRMVGGAAGSIGAADQDPAALLESLATPGGLTRLGLDVMAEGQAVQAWSRALDAVLDRTRSR